MKEYVRLTPTRGKTIENISVVEQFEMNLQSSLEFCAAPSRTNWYRRRRRRRRNALFCWSIAEIRSQNFQTEANSNTWKNQSRENA